MDMFYGNDSNPESEMPAEDNSEEMAERNASEGPTALLPKSILGGKEFKVGEEVVLKIVHDYEDEVEVAYATAEKPEKGKGRSMSDAYADMEAMAPEEA